MVVRSDQRSGIIGVPLDAPTDLEITTLANLISLTPGTLSLDVSTDRKTLYVHAIEMEDAEQLKKSLKRTFEQRIMRALGD